MILELAIGDAYGAGFEYARDRRFINKNNTLTGYVKHPRHNLKPGAYTDDTQMSIAITELILQKSPWTPESIAAKFVDVFHRDPRPGYAGRFYSFLKKTKTGKEFLENIKPTSDKSGAAMRAAPVGVFKTPEEVIEKCRVQAAVTHDTRDGINAAVAASLMVHYFLYDKGVKKDLPQFLCDHVDGQWNVPWPVGTEVGSKGWMSVRAAITSLLKNDSMSRLLKSSVAWSGDTDTVATIALAAGSCCTEIEQDLPQVLANKLESGKYGKGFLEKLDTRLMKFRERHAR